ncbi:CYTH domain-containing protein [Microbacterium hominis]|uniref:CYTH domain-containing protein n=1 Tax=Microbacterium TaxID=33882 RepID=UPI00168BBF5F|nr:MULTISPECIES: CYTH domain-containing protein [Microbacterium]QOC25790.1 CYTH domain-containing protein [Microbacterium hominis]QOC29776.1 CYTH domain-containing protein [Microbacterium hominis]QYF97836.1 CYTH domain-containing protein [Microbacterium sp. PAMC21962]
MSTEPSRSLEIELTFDVHGDTPLPDLSGLPGVAVVDGPDRRELDARYLDVEGYALGRAGYAVRRRTGGPDAGWHIKGPKGADGGRIETHWPLDGAGLDDIAVPDAVASAVAHLVPGALAPIARIRNDRHAYLLRDADGGVVAEFVDDHVIATDERRRVETRWREWEFELGPAAPTAPAARAALLAAAAAAVTAAGGCPAASDSKLARALGL